LELKKVADDIGEWLFRPTAKLEHLIKYMLNMVLITVAMLYLHYHDAWTKVSPGENLILLFLSYGFIYVWFIFYWLKTDGYIYVANLFLIALLLFGLFEDVFIPAYYFVFMYILSLVKYIKGGYKNGLEKKEKRT